MAANIVSNPGIFDLTSNPQILQRVWDMIWMRRDQAEDLVLGQFFDVVTKDSGVTHSIQSVGSAAPQPVFVNDGEPLPYYNTPMGFPKTITLATSKLAVRVTKGLIQSQRWPVVVGMMSGMVKAGMRNDEYNRAAILNSGFTGTSGADGKALFADDHPQENSDAGTWDNLYSGAFTLDGFHAARLLARNMTNERGNPDMVNPNTVLVPNALERKAKEYVAEGKGVPDSNFNQPNVLLPLFGKPVVSPYLTSTTKFFIFGDRPKYESGLLEVVLSAWEEITNTPHDGTVLMDKQLRATKAFAFTTSRNTFGGGA